MCRVLTSLLECLVGPELYRIHQRGLQGFYYSENCVERYSGYTLKAVRCLWYLCKLASPFYIIALFRRGAFSMDNFNFKEVESLWIIRPFVFVTAVAGAAYLARGFGRYYNREYQLFMRNVSRYRHNPSHEQAERLLQLYDCEFSYFPVEFSNFTPLRHPILPDPMFNRERLLVKLLWQIPAVILLRTIGRRLLYPGSLQIFKMGLHKTLLKGRAELMEQTDGKAKRAKICTTDHNFVDTMFIDNRKSQHHLGKTLVICCEGNAGFYEIGVMATPMQAGYSVLGWNHPGFGCSTGEPLPLQELHAVDAVMQYAMQHLKFAETDILMFAWSIGGFPASWTAAGYPNIKGLVLDATFDDLLPLALARMPQQLASLVTRVVRKYLNLNVSDLISQYHGPALLIRRTLDEVLAIEEPELQMMINRSDYLLKRILRERYPHIVSKETLPLLDEWLRAAPREQATLSARFPGRTDDLNAIFEDYLRSCSITTAKSIHFPLEVGKNCDLVMRQHLTLYLAKLHMKDLDQQHCTPLPVTLFTQPWHPIQPE